MPKKDSNYKKIALFWTGIFLLGGFAGILGSNLLIPWLAGISPFSKIGWISRAKDGTTIINRTEKVTVSEDLAYLDAVNNLTNSVVAIRSERQYRLINNRQVPLAKPEILAEGSGFILTSDGYIVTSSVFVSNTATRYVISQSGKDEEATLVKNDAQNGLALFKISESNLPAVAMVDSSAIKLGERVFLMGMQISASSTDPFARAGFVYLLSPGLKVDFTVNQISNGGPLIDLEGNVFALAAVDKNGNISPIDSVYIRNLLK